MPQPSWIESPEDWNRVMLGPNFLPGVWQVVSEKGRDVDFKKSKGQDGGTETDNGSEAGMVTLTGVITAANWAAWLAVLPSIDPNRPGAASAPLDIVHPEPNGRGINAVRVLKITSKPPTARSGKQVTIQCREWFDAPKKAKSQSKKDAALPGTVGQFGVPVAPIPVFGIPSSTDDDVNSLDNVLFNTFG